MIVSPSAGMYIAIRTGDAGLWLPDISRFADGRDRLHPADLSGCRPLQTGQRDLRKHPQGLQRPAYDRTLAAVLESPRILLPASRAVEVDRMVRFGQELKRSTVLYGGAEALACAELLRQAQDASSGQPEMARAAADRRSRQRRIALRVLEMRDKAPSTPGALAKAASEIRVLFGRDGESEGCERKAVKKAIDAGLTPATRCAQ